MRTDKRGRTVADAGDRTGSLGTLLPPLPPHVLNADVHGIGTRISASAAVEIYVGGRSSSARGNVSYFIGVHSTGRCTPFLGRLSHGPKRRTNCV
ncbi:hypothetical protein ABL78_0539 [Leptomonas seymouri]|uniref:Uncharacterized protein n=1 Tax=Leptomonas seymouri TaxID=5684 RepID=A0A0N1PEG9_LEPSE|nr:hypothetical protein ABL78_0539 [Leptomonas seymouri]|eukprot:KPI90312.1 hypothetical protein ABL78_0539 [Leptomonas seymouri]